MRAWALQNPAIMNATSPEHTTLLDLVVALQSKGTDSEEALVAIIIGLIRSGHVRLTGIYAGATV